MTLSLIHGADSDFARLELRRLHRQQKFICKSAFWCGCARSNVVLDTDHRARDSLTSWHERTLVTGRVVLKRGRNPKSVVLAVEDHFAVRRQFANDVMVLFIEDDGTLHHLAVGADCEVVGACSVANIFAGAMHVSQSSRGLEPLTQCRLP